MENLKHALMNTRFDIDTVTIYAEDSLIHEIGQIDWPEIIDGLEKIMIDSSLEMVDFDETHYLGVHIVNTEDLYICTDTDEIMRKSDLVQWYEQDKEEFEYESLEDAIDAWTDMGGDLHLIYEYKGEA